MVEFLLMKIFKMKILSGIWFKEKDVIKKGFEFLSKDPVLIEKNNQYRMNIACFVE